MTNLQFNSLIDKLLQNVQYNNKNFDVHTFHALSDIVLFDTVLNHQGINIIYN